MTKRETAQILGVMQVVYPDNFKNLSSDALQALISVWSTVFADDPASAVQSAVMAHISASTDRFMPPPAVIKQRLVDIKIGDELTPAEAWQLAYNAAQRGLHNSKEEFDKLPPIVQRLVGSPNQLREWAMMDSTVIQSVVASNFQRSYVARAKTEREYMALPSSVRNTLSELSAHFALDGNAEKRPALCDN